MSVRFYRQEGSVGPVTESKGEEGLARPQMFGKDSLTRVVPNRSLRRSPKWAGSIPGKQHPHIRAANITMHRPAQQPRHTPT